jgi:AraC-like DNA-binding protein
MRMEPIEKALWFIENRLSGEISLADIARSVGVSSHHLARAFGEATGLSLMRYARGRRLSEAARSLAAGAPDILEVAIGAGYGSHEAFTRAFRQQFGVTPETLRAGGCPNNTQLVEPIRMDKTLLTELDSPRLVHAGELLIAGIGARYTFETNQGIPAQWQRFAPNIGHVPNQAGPTATMTAALNMSPASGSQTFPSCRGISARCACRRDAMRCSPITVTSRNSAGRITQSGTSGSTKAESKSPMRQTLSFMGRNSIR